MFPDADSLKSFIEKIRSLNFFQRLFYWKEVRNALIDAAASLSRLLAEYKSGEEKRSALISQVSGYEKDLAILKEQKIRLEETEKKYQALLAEKDNQLSEINKQLTAEATNCRNFEKQLQSTTSEILLCKENIKHLQQSLNEATENCIMLRNEEEGRKREHSNTLATLNKITEQIRAERTKEIEVKGEQEAERLHKLKETWINHQSHVRACIRNLCNKHAIEFFDQVPFKGEPDNTIKICDEYIVFDAKSPASDDTSNFYQYLKDQAEKAKKYARQDGVKADIFFVVPANTLEVIKQTVFHLADYHVYLISAESLEPIILSLKRIEAYEFAQQLSPEERENICRVIGQFAHLTKRRIQIDSFFARQFIELVYKCENNLPDDILEKVAEFERAEKLNPPMEKRAKAINTRQLELDVSKLETEAGSKGIAVEDLSNELNGVRLYKEI